MMSRVPNAADSNKALATGDTTCKARLTPWRPLWRLCRPRGISHLPSTVHNKCKRALPPFQLTLSTTRAPARNPPPPLPLTPPRPPSAGNGDQNKCNGDHRRRRRARGTGGGACGRAPPRPPPPCRRRWCSPPPPFPLPSGPNRRLSEAMEGGSPFAPAATSHPSLAAPPRRSASPRGAAVAVVVNRSCPGYPLCLPSLTARRLSDPVCVSRARGRRDWKGGGSTPVWGCAVCRPPGPRE